MSMSQDDFVPRSDESPEPSRWERELFYALLWLPPLGVLVFVVPLFGPIFEKLNGAGRLSEFTYWLWRFVSFNDGYGNLPVLFVFVMLRALAEYLIIVSRRARHPRLCLAAWRIGVICVCLFLWFPLARFLLLPVSKMSSVVASSELSRAQAINVS